MKRRAAALAAISGGWLLASGCGYVGEPMPPLLNIPRRIEDLRAVERGDRIAIEFTAPARTTEDMALKEPARLELRAGPPPQGAFDMNAWSAEARRYTDLPAASGTILYKAPARDWVGREVLFAVKAIGANGRESGWSNIVAVTVIPPLERPPAPSATVVPEGVRLEWKSSAPAFRVFRQGPQDKEPLELARAPKPVFLDSTAEFGTRYVYTVQGVAPALSAAAESEISEAAEIVPKDTFPPAAPSGLRALAGTGRIELSWDPGSEADLAGYRVYRAETGGTFARVGEDLKAPSFGDTTVVSGKTYRYSVAAFDKLGNESKPGEPVEIAAP